MSDVFVVETATRTAGIAVRESDGFRFHAAHPDFIPLDGQVFADVAAIHARLGEGRRAVSRRRLVGRAAAMLALAVLPFGGAAAQATWPEKPVRIIVPVSPGGSLDMLARILAARLHEAWKQPVVVENRAGASSNIAFELVAKSPPDGYTLLVGWDSLAINPAVFEKLPFHPIDDFAPITQTISAAQVLVVRNSLGVGTLQEFIALARKQGGRITLASPGTGSIGHLAAELLKERATVEWVHVPYKGGGPALADLAGNHVDGIFLTLPAAAEQIRAGNIRALAVSTTERSPVFPSVPTVAEQGYPGYEVVSWQGLLAPAGTPRSIVERVQAEVARVLGAGEVRSQLEAQGFLPVGSTPEAFAAVIKSDVEKYAALIPRSGIRPE